MEIQTAIYGLTLQQEILKAIKNATKNYNARITISEFKIHDYSSQDFNFEFAVQVARDAEVLRNVHVVQEEGGQPGVTDTDIKVIYGGGFIPAIAIVINTESSHHGWLCCRHPDGRWVTLCNVLEDIKSLGEHL